MATIYRRINIHNKDEKQGTWEEIRDLDKRVWSEPEKITDPDPDVKKTPRRDSR